MKTWNFTTSVNNKKISMFVLLVTEYYVSENLKNSFWSSEMNILVQFTWFSMTRETVASGT